MTEAPPVDAVGWHEQIAEAFDAGYDRSPAFRERHMVWQELIAGHVRAGDEVLDAGCGSGVFSLIAAQRAGHVRGIDGSAAMIGLCNAAREKAGITNVTFDQLMLSALDSFPDAMCDVILSSSVLEYVPAYESTLRSFRRLLRPGGRLILSMPNGQSAYRWAERAMFAATGRPRYLRHVINRPAADHLRAQLARCGLTVVDTRYFAEPPSLAGTLLTWLPVHRRKTLFVQVATRAD